MIRLFKIGIETLAAGVFLLPILLAENKLIFKNKRKTAAYLIFALYLSALFAAVGIPAINYIRFNFRINMIPISPMANDLENSFLNIILFLPFGFMLPCLWKKYQSFWQTIFCGFMLSLVVELLQLFTYRATDINDLITNTLGTALGFGLAKILFKKHAFFTPAENSTHFYLVTFTAFLVMFFLQPFLSSLLWRFLPF